MPDDAPRVLVTGASLRVGRAIAERLAARGARLVLHCRRRGPEMEETLARVASRGGGAATVVECDFDDERSLDAFTASIGGEPWDGLVLNAAIYAESEARADHDAAAADPRRPALGRREAERFFRVNASAALQVALALAPALARSGRPGGGAIVAMGDIHARGRPVRGFAPYLMSKAALGQLVDSLAVELAPRVRVNAVDPGVVAWPEELPEEARRAYVSRVPLARSGVPDDAAAAVEWLLLDAPYVTGVHLPVDGGRSLR